MPIDQRTLLEYAKYYDPPCRELPDHLRRDPVHKWRARHGIELIHREPSPEELERIWQNWQLMDPRQKRRSDRKSRKLYGVDNMTHYNQLKMPVIIQKEAAVFKPIWNIGKSIIQNPWGKRILLGGMAGAAIGGTANMMAGQHGEEGKNFGKGALIGAGIGAGLGVAPRAFKSLKSITAINNGAVGTP